MMPAASEPGPSGHMVELSCNEALKLLGTVQLGRVALTDQALPAIRPVNHLVDEGEIIVRTHGGSALLGRTPASEGRKSSAATG
ncbi:pyridoxamine 5'-phosphate oxidase family protein [Streptomyces sp. NPDC059340]|uniref:pyridoxamine 5'-phosphate oxidase family protein n=1 Tax=Streptomyces sp. NPDC059340 TaxID=3346806 RepID=UPI0036A7AAA9